MGVIHLADEGGRLGAEDLLAGRVLRPADVGRLRRDALREALDRTSERRRRCATSAGPLDLAAPGLGIAGGPYSLLIAAIDPETISMLCSGWRVLPTPPACRPSTAISKASNRGWGRW